MAYALAEYTFGVIAPLLWTDERAHVFGLAGHLLARHHTLLTAAQWRGTLWLFGCYLILGVLTGVAGLLIPCALPDKPHSRYRAITLTMVLVFGIHLFSIGLPASSYLAAITAMGLIGAAVFTRQDGHYFFGLAKLPGLVAFLLIVSGWLIERFQSYDLSIATGTLSMLLALVGIYMLAGLARRCLAIARRHVSGYWALPHPAMALIAALSVGAWVHSSTASSMPIRPLPGTQAAARPNVILITLDTVRADHMGVYGYARHNTPNLQSFAGQSTLYSHFVAAAPLTLTSHASIFTGLYPQSHGAFPVHGSYPRGRPLADTFPTLATILRQNGYLTLGVIANNNYLRPEFGLTKGFQFVDVPEPVQIVSGDGPYLLKNVLRRILSVAELGQDLDRRYITAREVNQRAFRWLERAGRQSAPFFLFLNYMDAHTPYVPPAPFDRFYPGRDPKFDTPDYNELSAEINDSNKYIDARVRAHLTSQYDGAIAYLDAQLGELIFHLKHTGQYKDTLIVITSDHGESFGERNLLGHDTSIYQNEVAIPLIIKYPNTDQGRRDDRLASHVDLLPTILESTGISPLPGAQGASLLRPGAPETHYVVSEFHGSALSVGPRFTHPATALYWSRYKLIYSTAGARELYDLSADPEEKIDLFRQGDPIAVLMTGKLRDWSRQTPPKFVQPEQSLREAAKRLDSLGYAHTVSH